MAKHVIGSRRTSFKTIRKTLAIDTNDSIGDLSDKFWVPDDICQKMQNQRSSLPTSIVLFDDGSSTKAKKLSLASAMDPNERHCVHNRSRRASMFDPIDPTELQMTHYDQFDKLLNFKNASLSATTLSARSLAVGQMTLGTIEIGIEYAVDKCKLYLDLIRVVDLSNDCRTNDDTVPCLFYSATCTLMPDRITKHVKSLSSTYNPTIYKENTLDFDLDCNYMHLDTHFVDIHIFENSAERPSTSTTATTVAAQSMRCAIVASTRIYLDNLNVELSTKRILIRDLKPHNTIRKQQTDDLGGIMFYLTYLPNSERLTVGIMKARNLTGIGAKCKAPDSLVKVILQTKRQKKMLKKKKTSTQKSSKNPVFNEELVFININKDQLANDIEICIQIWHDSSSIKMDKQLLGQLALSSDTNGDEYDHWRSMIECNKSKAWWHMLSRQQQQQQQLCHTTMIKTRQKSTHTPPPPPTSATSLLGPLNMMMKAGGSAISSTMSTEQDNNSDSDPELNPTGVRMRRARSSK